MSDGPMSTLSEYPVSVQLIWQYTD